MAGRLGAWWLPRKSAMGGNPGRGMGRMAATAGWVGLEGEGLRGRPALSRRGRAFNATQILRRIECCVGQDRVLFRRK